MGDSAGSDNTLFAFWSALENIIRPNAGSNSGSNSNKLFTGNNSQQPDSIDKILSKLNGLKSDESFQNRLKTFEELIRLSDLFNFNENLLNTLLQLTRDMYTIDSAPIEVRRIAFENLIQLYLKQTDKFETFLLKNHLLSFIINSDSNSKCLFLYTLNTLILDSSDESKKLSQNNNNSQNTSRDKKNRDTKDLHQESLNISEDVKLRLTLFNTVTKNGTSCKHLDPELTTECLIYFILNSKYLNEGPKHLFRLFENLITAQYFQFIDDNLLFLLTEYISRYSYFIIKSLTITPGVDSANAGINSSIAQYNKQQQLDIKECVQLTEHLIMELTTIDCVKHVVVSLCELLNIVWLNHTFRNSDSQMNSMNELIISQIYQCLNKLFTSPIGNCSIFTFFTEIFLHSNTNLHRSHQINGALMHIKQLFDEFRHTKIKNTFLIKELHLNCLIYLPNTLKSCCSSEMIRKNEQLIIFEHILILTIDLVHLATHRDLFMCLLTFNSRKFLIEIIDNFSAHIKENKQLIQKYAELLNLLDKKDVFSYKTSNTAIQPLQTPSSGALSPGSSCLIGDEIAFNFQKFKESFYELVFKFPHTYYLTESCINNCIEFYLQRKLLPCYNLEAVSGIKQLLEKYFRINQCHNIVVRKFVLDTLSKKLHDYKKFDQKLFAEDIIRLALLPICDESIEEDDKFYHSLDNSNGSPPTPSVQQFHSDLVEMKYFIVTKLTELAQICVDENSVFKIISIFERIVSFESSSSIELMNFPIIPPGTTPVAVSQTSTITKPSNSVVLSPPLIGANFNLSFNQNLNYLNKIVQGLIELFERHFSSSSACFTKSCVKIFQILTNYLESYYSLNGETIAKQFFISSTAQRSQSDNQKQHVYSQLQANANRYFNYYAQIRRDIFEFLLRIRSDNHNRMLLLNRGDRRKFLKSKYLIIDLELPDENHELAKNVCLNFSQILNLVQLCLDKEVDWNVLVKVLQDLPFVLQYEMNLIKDSDFLINIFKYFYKREIGNLRNRPENLTRPDYICKFYPLISSLVLYHPILERSSQENILQNFAVGISSFRYRFCLETLTIAITEMHEKNAKQCAEILLKLSQFSPSQNMAQPVLELLSIISDLKKLDSAIFGRKEFIAVSAIAIKYTDPLKFNPFIILLAHYVICIWFIKCKQDFRKNYASFTCKGLYQEVIVQLDRLSKQQQASGNTLKDSKSPSRVLIDQEIGLTPNTSSDRLNQNLTAKFSNPNQSQPGPNSATLLNESSKELKANLTENMKVFYRELVEITLDFMSNNMYFDNALHQQLTPGHNQNEFLVDVYSTISTRSNGIMDSDLTKNGFKAPGNTKNSQSRSWIVGNRIIQIKTGLFSNICVEEPLIGPSKKQRANTCSKNESKTNMTNKTAPPPTQAINIPNKNFSLITGSTITNTDSYESSESSNNNSFSSHVLSNNTALIGATSGSESSNKSIAFNKSNSERPADSHDQESGSSVTAKSEQDLFDETIDNQNETMVLSEKSRIETGTSTTKSDITPEPRSSSVSSNRRINLIKRRYKSGIPLNKNRNDDDSVEEIYLRSFYDGLNSKTSKDDSDINSLANSMCCLKTDTNYQQKDCLYHSNCDHLMRSNDRIAHHYNHRQSHTSSNKLHRHHHKHQSGSAYGSSYQTNENSDQAIKGLTSAKEICHPNCWCNNLVEVTCRYPTKVVTYVTLIESNNCTSHDLNMSAFDSNLLQNKSSNSTQNNNSDVLSSINTLETSQNFRLEKRIGKSDDEMDSMNEKKFDGEKKALRNGAVAFSLSEIAANAIELRRKMSLSRISESSPLQDSPVVNAIESSEKSNEEVQSTESQQRRNSVLMRRTSFDSKMKHEPNSNRNEHLSGVLDPEVIERENKQRNEHDAQSQKQIQSTSNHSTYNMIRQKTGSSQMTSSLDPSQVFLHLFQTQHSNVVINEKDQPMIIPENSASQRSMNILDYLPCYLIHKIGVVYIGKNQANDEKAILSNANGSLRYRNFINGLGNLIGLKDLDTDRYYSGGLENDGSAGEFTLTWFDGIIQVVFHVATMMPLNGESCNFKKKHIGNDSTIIVYNESEEEYQFGMIKGEVNCICIEIQPLKSNTNVVKVKTTNEIAQSSWVVHQEQKFVSDQNLSIITRKMALHADLATKCYRFQKDGNGMNPYGGKWYERLKQINRIRKSCKEFYTKQQRPTSEAGVGSRPVSTLGFGSTAIPTSSMKTQTIENQLDFTDYI